MRAITHIVVHCSATPEGKAFFAKDIKRWHTDPPPAGRGWSDIGYHFVIDLDGKIEKGRNISVPGAHVEGHNATTIGICLVGGMDKLNQNPKNTYTVPQFQSLHELVHDLKHQFPDAEVLGHRDFPGVQKACPSMDIRAWWNGGHNLKGQPR